MLLRYRRHNPIDSAIGALYETPPGGAPAGSPAPPATGTPPANGGAAGGEPDRSSWIPRQRFDEVIEANRRYEEAERKRQADEAQKATDEAAKRGEFDTARQKLEDDVKAEKEKTKAESERATRIARRAAFISVASQKVADASAAYKLALADGMLDKLEVDDEGEPNDPKAVEAIVAELVKKYEFLKGGSGRNFGTPTDGSPNGGQPVDRSKMSAQDMLTAGYKDIDPRRR